MKKSEELELQVKELQKEIEKLKRQEDGVPKEFQRHVAIFYLKNRDFDDLGGAFLWEDTAQGENHWEDICDGLTQLSDADIIQIQEWIIRSYAQEFGQ